MFPLARKSVLLLMIHYLLILATIAVYVYGACDSQGFKVIEECVCPGSTTAVYECKAVGIGFTQWAGSAFNCPNSGNEIFLSHTDFDNGIRKECNNGAIIGQSLQVNGSCFTSQLTVNISTNLNGTTIGCTYDTGSALELIGITALTSSTDSLSPPKNVRLSDVSPGVLVFSWTPVPLNCSAVTYEIKSNCGECPNFTSSTLVTCVLQIPLVNGICTFAVRSVICDNTIGGWSNEIEVILRVPNLPPFTKISSRYDPTNLLGLDVQFSHLSANSIISNDIDGSVLNYTVTFVTHEMCASITILPASCSDVCATSLPLSCFPLRGNNIIVSVSATNVLGKGPTNSVVIGNTNRYVNVTAESTGRITCTFLNQQEVQMEKSCNVSYGRCAEQLSYSSASSATNGSGSVAIQLDIESDVQDYCYAAIANNGTFSVLIEGSFSSSLSDPIAELSPGNNPSNRNNEGFIAAISVTVILIVLISSGAAMLILYIWLYYKLPKTTRMKKETEEQMHLLGDEQRSIRVHIYFDLKDKPKEFMSALERLDTLQINIKNIKIGPRTLLDKLAVRRIYMECWKDLTNEEKQAILDLRIGVTDTLTMYCEAETLYVKCNRDAKTIQQSFAITEFLEDKPGALLSLLKVVDSVEECKRINITDIDLRKLEDCTQVTIMFLPDMAEDWKTEYDKKRGECKSIFKQTTVL